MRLKLIGVAFMGAVLLAGCSAKHPSSSSPPGTSASTTSAPKATPSPPPTTLSAFSKAIVATDRDGYRFTIDVNYQVSAAEIDPTGDKPGETSIFLATRSAVRLTNDTPDREIKFASVSGVTYPQNQPTFFFVTGWKRGSVVCEHGSNLFGRPVGSDGGCAIVTLFWRVEQTLAPSMSLTPKVYSGLPDGAGTAGLPGLPEDRAEEIKKAVLAPDYYLIGYAGGDWQRFQEPCPGGYDSLSGAGFKLVYSSTGACEEFTQLQQAAAR